jgi:hypothetical protein
MVETLELGRINTTTVANIVNTTPRNRTHRVPPNLGTLMEVTKTSRTLQTATTTTCQEGGMLIVTITAEDGMAMITTVEVGTILVTIMTLEMENGEIMILLTTIMVVVSGEIMIIPEAIIGKIHQTIITSTIVEEVGAGVITQISRTADQVNGIITTLVNGMVMTIIKTPMARTLSITPTTII